MPTTTTTTFDATACDCCGGGVAPCPPCSHCAADHQPKQALVTFAGFTSWAAPMNRSFVVDIGYECNPTLPCYLGAIWDGIECLTGQGHTLWQHVRLEMATTTRYVVKIFTPDNINPPCTITTSGVGGTAYEMTFQNATDDFTEFECDKTTDTILANTSPATVCCLDCSGGGGDDTINVSGVTCTVAVLSRLLFPSTMTLTFSDTGGSGCAATLGGPYLLTYNSGTMLYEFTSAVCGDMLFAFDHCTGSLVGTGSSGGISGTAGLTDLDPLSWTTGGTLSSTAACCSAPDAANTKFTVVA